jgi:AcrR family transcriptional regulator
MTKAAEKKSEATRTRILDAALALFRERGFEQTTMREVAQAAGMAVGAAYYYFDSKQAIVLAFYERAQNEMLPEIAASLDLAKDLEVRLRTVIGSKFNYFAPNRRLLGALSAHTDPQHPLSPFGRETRAIRETDIALFERAATDSAVKLPPTVRPYLARLLWMYQMGLILFWVYDDSPDQSRTRLLYDKTLNMLLVTLKLAGLPLLRPLHRLAGELLQVIYNDPE